MNKLIPEVGTLFLLLNYKKNNEVKGERTSDSCEHTLNTYIRAPFALVVSGEFNTWEIPMSHNISL